jgi:hypothetical protein
MIKLITLKAVGLRDETANPTFYEKIVVAWYLGGMREPLSYDS